jgi:hypothetical protein
MREHGLAALPSTIIRDVDPRVERVIMACLEPDPERRPSSALSIASELPFKKEIGRPWKLQDVVRGEIVGTDRSQKRVKHGSKCLRCSVAGFSDHQSLAGQEFTYSFFFRARSFSWMNVRISSAMPKSFSHCSR